MTYDSTTAILAAIIVAGPSLIGLWKSYHTAKLTEANTKEITKLGNAVIEINTHINSKMDLLLKVVEAKGLLEGVNIERARRDTQDLIETKKATKTTV